MDMLKGLYGQMELTPKFRNKRTDDFMDTLELGKCGSINNKRNINGCNKNRYSSNNVSIESDRLYRERMNSVSKGYMHLFIMPQEVKIYRTKQCYEVYSQGKMDIGIAQSIIGYVDRKINNYKGLLVSWVGGEPLLAMEIVEYLSDSLMNICEQHRKKYMAEMVTNGYLLSVNTLEKLYMHKVYSYGIVIDDEDPLCEKQRELVNGGEVYAVVLENLISIKETAQNMHLKINVQLHISKKKLNNITELYIDQFKKQFSNEKLFDISTLVSWKNENKIDQGNENKKIDNIYINHNNGLIKNSNEISSRGLRETVAFDVWEQSYRKRDLIIGFDGKLYRFANEFGEDRNLIGYIAQDGTFNWNRKKRNENG